MQITFDPRDPSQVAIVAQIINAAPVQVLTAPPAAEIPDDVKYAWEPSEPAAGNATSTDIGAGIPQPMPAPSAPNGAASTPTVPMPSTLPAATIIPTGPTGADDEEGEPSDGTGLDAEGLPWDARIHSSSKKKTAKGLWAARKGGPKGDELAAIKDELRGMIQQPLPLHTGGVVSAPIPMPLVGEIVAPTVLPTAPMPIPVPVPPMPAPLNAAEPVPTPLPIPMPTVSEPPVQAQPVAAPVPQPVAGAEEWDFAKLMAQIAPKIGSGAISTEYLVQVCAAHGINSVTDTASKPEVIPALVAQFKTDGVW